MPILDAMHKEQMEDNVNWTPSKMIDRCARALHHPAADAAHHGIMHGRAHAAQRSGVSAHACA